MIEFKMKKCDYWLPVEYGQSFLSFMIMPVIMMFDAFTLYKECETLWCFENILAIFTGILAIVYPLLFYFARKKIYTKLYNESIKKNDQTVMDFNFDKEGLTVQIGKEKFINKYQKIDKIKLWDNMLYIDADSGRYYIEKPHKYLVKGDIKKLEKLLKSKLGKKFVRRNSYYLYI